MGNFFSDTWKDLTQPGWRQANQANKTQQAAISAQGNSEAFKQGQAGDLAKMAEDFLWGTNGASATNGADGAPRTPITGAVPSAEEWIGRYTNWLKNSPDLTYNRQRGALERIFNQGNESVTRAMGRRGLTNSGLYGRALGSQATDRARGVADLVGQAEDRRGQRIAAGTQLTQSNLDRALNMFSGAKGAALNLNTQVPQLMTQLAGMQGNAPQGGGVIQDLLGQYVQSQMGNWFPQKIGPNDVAVGSGGGANSLLSTITNAMTGGGSPISSAARSYLFKALGL